YMHFPAQAPYTGVWGISYAEARAMGKMVATGTSLGPDGYIGFGANISWTFDSSHGVAPGTFDFTGTVLNEVTEVLGRMYGPGMPMDWFRFSGPGVATTNPAVPSYFSIDGGVTNLASYSTTAGSDYGDLNGADPSDMANAFATSGVARVMTSVDWLMLDV